MVMMAQGSRNEGHGETTPLLRQPDSKTYERPSSRPVLYLLLLTAFLVSLTFGITQVPILYAFRIMTCDAYYEKHTPDPSKADRCARWEIEAGAARSFALLSASTTIFGLVNLLVTGWTIKRLGVKRALIVQIFWPAVRLLIQTVGVGEGGDIGIAIVQASQFITVIGGPNGYVLCLNSFVVDVVGHEARTGALGRLQGCMYIGSAIGFLVGGLIGDAFGIIAPFKMTLVLFLSSCIFVALVLPATPRAVHTEAAANSRKLSGMERCIGPLRIFTPQRWMLPDGRTIIHVGALTLGIGVFLGILATGYIGVLLQQYATSKFDFGTKANGYLIFMYSSLRGLYLTFVFPRIIARGRSWVKSQDTQSTKPLETEGLIQDVPTSPSQVETVDPLESEEPPNPAIQDDQETFEFDLFYARFSVFLDAFLTGAAMFVTQGWQMYIVALVLPFAAGTGAASKGSILQMLPVSDRVDALGGITLVENIARLSTTAVFGLVFSVLAEVGHIHLVFVCNGAVALLAFIVLLISRFPPKGASRLER